MRLMCNGVTLDLERGATMSFQRVNPLFAFDKISCERTQAFKLPATPTNNRVLALAKIPAYDGRGMRRRFAAEYQDGVVVKRGYLYVDKYENGHYNAIFVTGELVGLQAIKDVGSIRDVVKTYETTRWGDTIDATEAFVENPTWRSVLYEETFPNAIPFPSYSLVKIMNLCFDALDMPHPAYPSARRTNAIRVIPSAINGIDDKMVISSKPRANSASGDLINDLMADETYFVRDTFDITNGLHGACASFNGHDRYDRPVTVRYLATDGISPAQHSRKIACLRARFDCDIYFDENAPDLVLFKRDISTEHYDYGRDFGATAPEIGWAIAGGVGDYAAIYSTFSGTSTLTFNKIAKSTHTIRGKRFHITAGERIGFIDVNDLVSDTAYEWQGGRSDDAYYTFRHNGQDYFSAGQKQYELTMGVSSENPMPNDVVALQPNLPDISLVEALKIVANANGVVLNYTDASGVVFEALDDVASWQIVDVSSKILGVSRVTRTFADYAQHNRVEFDSSERVYTYERISEDYAVDNDNIKADRVLFTIPFSEGGIGDNNYEELAPALVRNADEQATDKSTIAVAMDGDTYLGRLSVLKNDFISRLCDASTTVVVRARMSAYEYNAITPKTRILLNGTLYVWTEARWSKGVAEFTLAKIA